MAKQSIFGRISTLVKANINAMLDQAEDPQKMLDQLVRDYTNNIADAEAAIAETIGNLRLLERDHQEDLQSASDWGNKALAASRKADEFRAAGDSVDADKFDNLAKVALQRQIAAENSAKAAAPQIASQTSAAEIGLRSHSTSMMACSASLIRSPGPLLRLAIPASSFRHAWCDDYVCSRNDYDCKPAPWIHIGQTRLLLDQRHITLDG